MVKTPRVIFIRHGQTEWSENGRYTSRTELPLTKLGAKLVAQEGRNQVGPGRAIDTSRVCKVFVSPRLRARQTMELLLAEHLWEIEPEDIVTEPRITEWDYGAFEGLKTAQINEIIGHDFDIWNEGCKDGESPDDITERLDALISDIRKLHAKSLATGCPGDILLFGHGHILRAFVMRWIGVTINDYHPVILPAGGIGVLTYAHDNINEPALYLGGTMNH